MADYSFQMPNETNENIITVIIIVVGYVFNAILRRGNTETDSGNFGRSVTDYEIPRGR